MKKISILFISLGLSLICISQVKKPSKWCYAKFPDSLQYRRITDMPNKPTSYGRLIDANGVILIPVVFHIVYNNSDENIPDTRILSQIQRINTDLRNLNPEVANLPTEWLNLPGDIKIELRLACIDPLGNPTTGILRKSTTVSQFTTENQIKFNSRGGDDAWPTEKYLNIWIGDLDDPSDYLGDATFPEEYNQIVNGDPGFLTDGIILDYSIVGTNNHTYNDNGRILSHELGHWLGLLHTFSEVPGCLDTDGVTDTPSQFSNNYRQCPTIPFFDACQPSFPGALFMDYMTYANDPCRYLYTVGQKNRIRNYFNINGPVAVRYSHLNNYFGIKRFSPSTPCISGNQLIVNMNNPMCLPVNYSFTGPVTEISRDNQKITLQVNTGVTSGTISMTASSSANNYTDDYNFNFQVIPVAPTFQPTSYQHIDLYCTPSATYTLSVANIPGATFQWSLTNVTGFTGNGTNTIQFTPATPPGECQAFKTSSTSSISNSNLNTDDDPSCIIQVSVSATINGCTSPLSQISFGIYTGPGNPSCCDCRHNTCCGDPLKIYPNPAKNQITIEAMGEYQKMIHTVELIDYTGTKVKMQQFAKGIKIANINTSQLKPGEYIVRIFDGEKWITSKAKIIR
jgi:hypothetical protein